MEIDIIQIIPHLGVGGAEKVVEDLAKELKKNKINVLVISLYSSKTFISDQIEKSNIPIIFLNKKKGFDFSIFLKLYRIFKELNPKVVHSHLSGTLYSVPPAFFNGIKIKVHTVHNMANKDGNIIMRVIYHFYYKFLNLYPVTISNPVKKSFIQTYNIKNKEIPLIYNGIDLSNFTKKNSYEVDLKNINILHVGNFKEAKNHEMIIKAFKKILQYYPYARLNLIGEGHLKGKIVSLVNDYGIEKNVFFIGQVNNVKDFLQTTDIFILPSLWEGMPISLIEAMATGMPIVATRVGGIPDMVDDRISALLINVDEDELTNSIVELIKNKKLRSELGNNAYNNSKKYSNIEMTKNYVAFFKIIGGFHD